MYKNLNFRKGITIIELLVTIIIIGILAAIAMPRYNGWIERKHAERAMANIELIASALKMYYIKQGAEPTYPINGLTGPGGINPTLNLELIDTQFTPYIIDKPVGSLFSFIKATYNDGRYIQWNIDITDGDPDELDPGSSWF